MTKIDYTQLGYSTDTIPMTLNVRLSYPINQIDQRTVYAPMSQLPQHILEQILTDGLARVLNDGIGGAKLSNDERVAKLSKRLDSMMAGSWRIKEREPSLAKLMREALVADMQKQFEGSSVVAIEKRLRSLVKTLLGENENATMDNIMRAIAKQKAGDDAKAVEALYDKLDAKYTARARELAAERANASNAVNIDIADFDI